MSKLIDNSPIQDTYVCNGNATRYVELENPIVLEGDFEIEFDWIRQDSALANNFILAVSGTAAENCHIRLYDSGASTQDIRLLFEGGLNATSSNALANIAQGQHCHIKIQAQGGVVSGEIDGAAMPAFTGTQTGTFSAGYIGSRDDSYNPFPANSALQNVVIRDLDNNRTWEYNLDESSGTAANNTGTAQGNVYDQPLWDRATLDGNGTRYIEIPQVAFGSSDDFSVRLDWIRTTGLTQDLLGDGTSGIRVQDGTDNIFVIGESGTATLSAAAAGIANGEHVSLEFRRVSGSTEGFVNGASVAVSGTAIGEFLVSLLYQYTGINILAAGSAIGNVILENLTTGEYVCYKIDEGPE